MKSWNIVKAVLCTAAAMGWQSAMASTASLTASEDNFMLNGTTFGNYNWGAWGTPQLAIGMNSTSTMYRTLLRFDLASLGEIYEVNSATMTLTQAANTKIKPDYGDFETRLFLLDNANAGWIEGTGTGSAVVGASCWNKLAYNTTNWVGGAGIGNSTASDGIDRLVDTVQVDTASIQVGSQLVFNLSNATDFLKSWATNGPNAGFFLTTDENPVGQNALLVGSREHSTSTYRPTLAINYLAMSNAFVKADNALAMLSDSASWTGTKDRNPTKAADHVIFNSTLSAGNATVNMGAVTTEQFECLNLRVEDVQGGLVTMTNATTAYANVHGAFVMTNSTDFTKLNGGMHFEAGSQVLIGAGRTLMSDGDLLRGNNTIVNDGSWINRNGTTPLYIDRDSTAAESTINISGGGTMSSYRIDFSSAARAGAVAATTSIDHSDMTMLAGDVNMSVTTNRIMTYTLTDALMKVTNTLSIGASRSITTDFTIRGSSVVTANVIRVGSSAGVDGGLNQANVLVQSGSMEAGTSIILGNAAFATGAVTQVGGAVRTASLEFAKVDGGQGTYHLAGGTLTVGAIKKSAAGAGAGDGRMLLDGGILKPIADSTTWIGGATAHAMDIQLTTAGGKIDTAGYNVTVNDGMANAPSEAGTLTKQGLGALALAGVNTYSGATTITAGTLALNATGSISNSAAITVAAGATFDVSSKGMGGYALANGQVLSGSGTVNGNLIVGDGAILAPGNSPGTLEVADLTWSGGGILDWEVATNSAAGVAGTDWDFLDVSGSFVNQATAGDKFTINIKAWNGFSSDIDETWKIMTANDISGFSTDAFLLNDETGSGGTWSISADAQNLYLTHAIPEPAVVSLMALAGAAMLVRRRMKNRG